MWQKPQLMTAVADLLLVTTAATLVAAGLVWVSRLPLFPLRAVELMAPTAMVTREDIERTLAGTLDGRFFAVNVDHVRGAFERLPWVRRAEVRRVWPGRLQVRLEEQVPVARWGLGSTQLVNGYGEVFYAATQATLPQLIGPDETAPDVLARYREFVPVLAEIGETPVEVALSSRLAWRVKTARGWVIELGREQPRTPVNARLARFAEVYPRLPSGSGGALQVADLRYPNGFALKLAGGFRQSARGNP
jgi:cell division protein FtsQ